MRLTCKLILTAIVLLFVRTLHAQTAPSLTFHVTGPMETIVNHKKDACNEVDIPDEAAHAWRDASGTVRLIASHHENLELSGPDLNHLKSTCKLAYAAGGSAHPEDFNDMGWIESVYTTDGKTIHGIVSMDYHPLRHHLPCSEPKGDPCWYSVLTQVDSHDGGRSFTAPVPGASRFIAGAPYQFDPQHPEVVGALVPTQMVTWNGYVYAFFSMAGSRDQKTGDCLVRTKDPADPAGWRAWDGAGFNVQFIDPYPKPLANPVAHTCQPVGGRNLFSPVRSLLRLDGNKGFLAVMVGPHRVGDKLSTAVLASTSTDLLNWSTPVPIMDLPFYHPGGCSTDPHGVSFGYPSLLDPASPSLNFNTFGSSGYLYLTLYRYCEGLNRDLVRFPISVTYNH